MTRLSNGLLRFLTDSRTLAALVLVVIAGLVVLMLWLDPRARLFMALAIITVIALLLLAWLYRWLLRKIRAYRAAKGMDEMVTGQADTEVLRDRIRDVVREIKHSRIGLARGRAALYELPWYMIIGNPAAGKSTAIINSGLRFPFSDNRASVIRGIGGTRDCDWYFTTEGIVLDTAGRYSVNKDDRSSWLNFLGLLRKNRPRAPINGILIAASIAELNGNRPEFAIDLAKSLRERVQEVVEQLGVFVPVYVIFTKADLIAGFNGFFQNLEPSERERVWGATLPFEPNGNADAVDQFDRHFDELSHGLKEMSLAQMAVKRGERVSPGLLTLPLEFAAIKPSLRAFISTLFEDNPYQFRPIFRGFYFTSAIQEGASVKHASKRVGERFALASGEQDSDPSPETETSYFLQDLFRKVIFSDRGLVRQYSNPKGTRARYVVFFAATVALGAVLSLWSWSYVGNRTLIHEVRADLQHAVALQENHVDLQSRLKATLILQNRLQQLVAYRTDYPVAVGLGLYQGRALESKIRSEYYGAMRRLMLEPVSSGLEAYLGKVVDHADQLTADSESTDEEGRSTQNVLPQRVSANGVYASLSPTHAGDAYNALKTYLMLGSGHEHISTAHLSDQLPRFWCSWLEENRGEMSREDMVEMAGSLVFFYISQADQPLWPSVDNSITLVSSARGALRGVMRGMPAIERTYTDIVARASTRYPSVTVASIVGGAGRQSEQDQVNRGVLVGSYAVSGTFTRQAWQAFVKPAIADAAHNELSSKDWVLDSTMETDLSVSRSPTVIKHLLTRKYKQDYIAEWRKFLHGISVARFDDFQQAVRYMGVLSDPEISPLNVLLEAVGAQTSWDSPVASIPQATKAKDSSSGWFSDLISDEVPAQVSGGIKAAGSAVADHIPVGRIARSFPGIGRLMASRGKRPSLMNIYLEQLRDVSSRLDSIANRGVAGRGALELMQHTLTGEQSEIAEAVDLVQQQILVGLEGHERQTLRAVLLRPLVQTYAALVPPAERELNRIWYAQVYQPFQEHVARKYPFNVRSGSQAAPQTIAGIFGPSGAIAEFGTQDLGALAIRRGNTLTSARWADVGIHLSPELVVNYGLWVSPLNAAGRPTSGQVKQTTFQILPQPAFKVKQYTLQIDGQRLRYRNTPPQWSTFVWPAPEGMPGVSVKAVTTGGRTMVLLDETGDNGLTKLFQAGQPERLGDDRYLLTWSKDDIEVSVKLRILNRPAGSDRTSGLKGVKLPRKIAATPVNNKLAMGTVEGAQ